MRIRNKVMGTALTGMALAVVGSAHAATVTSTTGNFSFNATISDSTTSGNSSSTTSPTINSSQPTISQFNSSLGVLTGVSLSITNSQQTLALTGSVTRTGSNNRTGNFYASGSSTATFNPLGGTSTTVTSGNLSRGGGTLASPDNTVSCSTTGGSSGATCTVSSSTNSSNNENSTKTLTSNLGAYAGAGNVASGNLGLSWAATNSGGNPLAVNVQTSSSSNVSASATAALSWTGSLFATYTYLLHSNASFVSNTDTNTLDIDFGTIFQGSGVASNGFNVFNLAGDRTGLDFTGSTGGSSPFSLSFGPLSNLTQGGSTSGGVSFDTSAGPGSYVATYILNFADNASTGVASTRTTNSLTINVKGTIQAVPAPVPVPAAAWLLGSALVGMVGIGRRKQV